MNEVEKKVESTGCDILLRNVPADVVQELARRAEVNFRSRMYEAVAILTAVCRSDATLPGLGIGETVPAASAGVPADAQDGQGSNQDGGQV